jgi:hypothetical protein
MSVVIFKYSLVPLHHMLKHDAFKDGAIFLGIFLLCTR